MRSAALLQGNQTRSATCFSQSTNWRPSKDDHYLAVLDPCPRFYRTSRICTSPIATFNPPLKLGIHFILTVSHEAYGNATSISRILGSEKALSRKPQNVIPEQYHWPDNNVTFVPNRRANATIVMLARNGDINGAARSIKQMEDRFNKRFRYPYVFLNEEPFTDAFKECVVLFIGSIITPLTFLATPQGG